MGNLPEPRVNPLPPFYHTSVDYAGLLERGQRTLKHYVSLFVCLATKAIHLDSVKDYTVTSFLTVPSIYKLTRFTDSHVQ